MSSTKSNTKASTQHKKMLIQAVVQHVRGPLLPSEEITLSGLDEGADFFAEGNDENSTASDTSESLYQWRLCDENGSWTSDLQLGTIAQFREKFSPVASDIQVCLLIAGTEVVTQSIPINIKERRHLRKLIPFELEDHLTDELSELHFALATPTQTHVVTAYLNNDWLSEQITELEQSGFEVSYCFPEPLMLPREDGAWTLRLDDYLHVHYGEGLGFSVERSLADVVLNSLLLAELLPEKILLLAADQDQIDTLFQMLPLSLREKLSSSDDNSDQEDQGEAKIKATLAEGWDSLDIANVADLDLRQGSYARQLPLKKWWSEWRNVAVLGLVALLVYVAVNIGQIQILKAKRADLVAERSSIFSQVIQGREQDAEKQLRNKLAEYENTSIGGSVVEMYALVAPLITSNKDVNLSSLRYTDKTGEMQLTLQAKSYGSVLALSEELTKKGLQARLQNTSQQGEQQQARMVITRAAL